MKAPFTLLTGFLGAGKTSALNRLLAGVSVARTEKRIAVLVNELGRIAIDNRLIVGASGDVIELAGGCLCCKLDMRSDLWGGIVDIIERSRPDHVILETTGIAEPPAILEGLSHFKVKDWVMPAGVVCVVDASIGGSALDERDEARNQLVHADRVLLSKLDIATAAATARAHERIGAVNPDAERASFPSEEAGNIALAAWVTEPRRLRDAGSRRKSPHAHSQVSAATFVDSAALAATPLLEIVGAMAPTLLRAKGFIHIADEPRRGILSLASGRLELTFGTPWAPDETRRTELVLIGENLREDALRRRLWSCRAGIE